MSRHHLRTKLVAKLVATISILTAVHTASAGDYCLAVRGNGELAPAHWGGFAKLVERMGLPKAMSGGSSGSVSLFLFDSISLNPILGDKDSETGRQRASLLVKSLESYLESIALRPEWQAALKSKSKNERSSRVYRLAHFSHSLVGLPRSAQVLGHSLRRFAGMG